MTQNTGKTKNLNRIASTEVSSGATGLQTCYFLILFSVTNSILTPYLLLPAIKWSKKTVIHIVIHALLFVLLLAGYCSSLLSTYTKEWESVFLEQYDSHQWHDLWHYLWHYLWRIHFIWPNQDHILNVMQSPIHIQPVYTHDIPKCPKYLTINALLISITPFLDFWTPLVYTFPRFYWDISSFFGDILGDILSDNCHLYQSHPECILLIFNKMT